jgi:hypothetical protein
MDRPVKKENNQLPNERAHGDVWKDDEHDAKNAGNGRNGWYGWNGRNKITSQDLIDRGLRFIGDALYGRSVFHCPYCDGWEVRDQPIAVYSLTIRVDPAIRAIRNSE